MQKRAPSRFALPKQADLARFLPDDDCTPLPIPAEAGLQRLETDGRVRRLSAGGAPEGTLGAEAEIRRDGFRPEAWWARVRADLAAQVEAGGTLYGYREDGAYVARTRGGERLITPAPDDDA